MIQKIKCLKVKLETILLGSSTGHGRRCGTLAGPHPYHPDLRSAHLLLLRTKILPPTQTRTDLPTCWPSRTVASNTRPAVVDYSVVVVVESSRNVVRQCGSRLNDGRDSEALHKSLVYKSRQQLAKVGC